VNGHWAVRLGGALLALTLAYGRAPALELSGVGSTVPEAIEDLAEGRRRERAAGEGGEGSLHAAEDATTHAMVAGLHFGVLQAAMVCDLIRVATFQYSPGTNHVAFQGMFPGEPTTIYMPHPESHKITTSDTTAATLGAAAKNAVIGVGAPS
jgi:hypothetical protein